MDPSAPQWQRECKHSRGHGGGSGRHWGQNEEEQKEEEEKQHDLYHWGKRTDEYDGLQTGEMDFSDQETGEGEEKRGLCSSCRGWGWCDLRLSLSSSPRSRSSAATPTWLSQINRPCHWPVQTQGRCPPSLVRKIQKKKNVTPVILESGRVEIKRCDLRKICD